MKGVGFTCVVNIPNKPYEVFTVGNDKKIWNSKDNKNGHDAGTVVS